MTILETQGLAAQIRPRWPWRVPPRKNAALEAAARPSRPGRGNSWRQRRRSGPAGRPECPVPAGPAGAGRGPHRRHRGGVRQVGASPIPSGQSPRWTPGPNGLTIGRRRVLWG